MYYRRGAERMTAYGFEIEFAQVEGVEFRTFVLSEDRFRFWMTVAVGVSLAIGALGTILPLRIGIKAFQNMEL